MSWKNNSVMMHIHGKCLHICLQLSFLKGIKASIDLNFLFFKAFFGSLMEMVCIIGFWIGWTGKNFELKKKTISLKSSIDGGSSYKIYYFTGNVCNIRKYIISCTVHYVVKWLIWYAKIEEVDGGAVGNVCKWQGNIFFSDNSLTSCIYWTTHTKHHLIFAEYSILSHYNRAGIR